MLRTYRCRDDESGMSAIPFVVSLLFVVGFAVAWYQADSDAKRLQTTINTLRTQTAAADEKFAAANERLIALGPVTGFGDVEGKPDKAALEAALQGALDKWREKLTLEFTADKYTPTATGGAIEKLPGDKVRVVYIPAKDQITNPSVQTILPLFENAAVRMQNDIKRFVEERAAAVAAKASAEKSFADAVAAKDVAIGSIRTEMETGFRTREEQIRELRDQVQSKDQAIQQTQTELETVRTESARQVATLTARSSQQTAELQTLARREQPFVSEGPDGAVLATGGGLVIINRGKKDMLMPGTMFKVLGRIKGGDLVVKGAVKVVVSHDNTADTRVVDQDPNNPIVEGDLVQSETYSPNRVMRFTLVGDFSKMGRAQAETRLRQLGAQVDANVTTETHYLVLGTAPAGENLEDSEAVKRAREYGVTVLTEAQLASFTLY